jgi:hypothetical protein
MNKLSSAAIIATIEELELGSQNRDWPSNLYHFSDINNIAHILRAGRVLCRARVQSDGVPHVEIANQRIINATTYAHNDVRLYFRPRTPMQHNIEGIRPVASRGDAAHCPVPVFLLFHSRPILTRVGVRFTNGNWAVNWTTQGEDAAFLKSIPWADVYHDGPRTGPRKESIKVARSAEVLVPDELPLDHLHGVVCRTGAERETLLDLLGTDADKWRDIIRLERQNERLFYRDHMCVSAVQLLPAKIRIDFHNASGLHALRGEVHAPGNIRWTLDLEPRRFSRQQEITLPESPSLVRVRLHLVWTIVLHSAAV